MNKSDFGLIGLAVMGENLVMNMLHKGYTVTVYNRTPEKSELFVKNRGKGLKVTAAYSLESFVDMLASPRKIMLMVKAGKPVDDLIERLIPLLRKGDILIDGGNSNFPDSNRRFSELDSKGILFVGTGISGGEEGALKGPSIMPGGAGEAWPYLKPIFQDISAKAKDGQPCCQWMGPEGAGHFVKTVHNGIEYGDMQLISEVYHLMKSVLKMTHDEMAETFAKWNRGDLDSYLVKITADIMSYRDSEGNIILEQILDSAAQKGTGKWMVNTALECGSPLTLISESVFSRFLSNLTGLRERLSGTYPASEIPAPPDKKQALINLEKALFASKIISYAQGFSLMRSVSESNRWSLDYRNIALIWRGGCIIRSVFLDKIAEAYEADPQLESLILDGYFMEKLTGAQSGWRETIAMAVNAGIPIPALSGALAYFDGIRCNNLPANLIQAQRDYFGAHRYQKKGDESEETHHTNWTGTGGSTTSSSYSI